MAVGICEKPSCGGVVEDATKSGRHVFCPDCGAHLILSCSKGHELVKAKQSFCTECGESLRPKKTMGVIKQPQFAEMD